MTLGIINADKPYFADIASAADATRDFAAKQAIQEHKAWLSVDVMGDSSGIDPDVAYSTIGTLIAALVQPDTLALACTPTGKIVAYDPCFLKLLQSGNVMETFKLGSVDRTIGTRPDDPELAAAAVEARRRLPEFLGAL